ncbi:hypothetical protein GCM10010363_69640 [Streptomyces omiyaensis]|nr:hypothetical protein GCM10010363_69640 [Streptomyces omiyaensis]
MEFLDVGAELAKGAGADQTEHRGLPDGTVGKGEEVRRPADREGLRGAGGGRAGRSVPGQRAAETTRVMRAAEPPIRRAAPALAHQ